MQKPSREGASKIPGLFEVLAFALPVLLLLMAYRSVGVFPFGDKSLLLVDMNNEYIDYFAHLNRTVREGGSFLRSWEMGMGLNMMGLIAFYAGSGLNLLVVLAPPACLTEAVLILTLLKVGLCGVFFRLYARYAFSKELSEGVVLAASVAYALCAYNLAYSSNIMWLDGVAMLPLVLLGIEKLLRENRSGLFAGSLVYVFLSSYYIGYMVGIFSFLYFTAVFFAGESSWRCYSAKLKRFLLSAAVAAGCCAFLLLPAFFELKNGQSALWSLSLSWELDISLTALGAKLLPGTFDTLTDAGLPNIYTSVAALMGCALFFIRKQASRREKLVFGALLGVLLLSFACSLLNLAWHAFEDPTWFPARFSFVFSFLLLYLALRGARDLQKCSPAAVFAAAGVLILLFVEVGIQRYRFVALHSVLLGIGLVLSYAALALLLRPGRLRKGLCAILGVMLPVLVCAEAAYNARDTVWKMDELFGYKTRAGFYDFEDTFSPAVQWVRGRDETARTEILQQRNANGGMALGYPGISHYSTTTDQTLNSLLRGLGYNTGTINEVRFALSTPLTNGLLGIRYVLSTEPLGEGYAQVAELGQAGVYQNTLAFPLAYFADDAVLDVSLSGDPFAYQNELIAALSGEGQPVFTPVTVEAERLENIERTQEGDATVYKLINAAEEGHIVFTLSNPGGDPAYAFLPLANRKFVKATAYVDDDEQGQRVLAYRSNSIINLGAGEAVTLRITLSAGTARLRGLYFYALDLHAAQAAANQATESGMQFDRFEDTYVSGTITAPRDGVLATSIPYDEGWHVTVDGQRAQWREVSGVFLALELSQGAHRIEMRYLPQGFVAGCALSVGTIALLGINRIRRGKKKRDGIL